MLKIFQSLKKNKLPISKEIKYRIQLVLCLLYKFSAINRYKNVVENYDQTIFVEEALHRLVEINYQIGLVEESKKYASLLGYNYQSSNWYKKSYKIFNKDYKEIIPNKKDKRGVINKFKKLFD